MRIRQQWRHSRGWQLMPATTGSPRDPQATLIGRKNTSLESINCRKRIRWSIYPPHENYLPKQPLMTVSPTPSKAKPFARRAKGHILRFKSPVEGWRLQTKGTMALNCRPLNCTLAYYHIWNVLGSRSVLFMYLFIFIMKSCRSSKWFVKTE